MRAGCIGKPVVAGKKLIAPVAKAAPGTAAAPVKTPSKAIAAASGQTPKPDDGKPKGKAKGKGSDAEKAPKTLRAKNAYMFFMADKRDAVRGKLVLYAVDSDSYGLGIGANKHTCITLSPCVQKHVCS